MNEIPAASHMLATRRQKIKQFCCFYWEVTVFTVGCHCWTRTWRTYRCLCYLQNRNNLLSIPHTSWLFHTDHIFSHEWRMFHFILDPTYLFSETFFSVRFYLFENGFSVPYFCVFLLHLYELLGLILTYGSCSNKTQWEIVLRKGVEAIIEVLMKAVSGNTLTHQSIYPRWYYWCVMQSNHLWHCVFFGSVAKEFSLKTHEKFLWDIFLTYSNLPQI